MSRSTSSRRAAAQLTLLARVGRDPRLGPRAPGHARTRRGAARPGVRGLVRDRPRRRGRGARAARRAPQGVPAAAAGRAARPRDRDAHGRARAGARDHRGRAVRRLARRLGRDSRRCARCSCARRCACRSRTRHAGARDALAAGDGAPLRPRGRRAGDARSRAARRPRSSPTARRAQTQMLFEASPIADVGLRLRDAARSSRSTTPPSRHYGYSRDEFLGDDDQGHPPAGGRPAAARRHQQPRRRRRRATPRTGATCAATAR